MFLRLSLLVGTFFLSVGTLAFDTEALKDSIIDLEQACELGHQEIDTLNIIVDKGDALVEHQKQFSELMIKLETCKDRLVTAYSSCSLPHDEESAIAQDMTPGDKKTMFANLAMGCDWFVRIAGIIWGMQVFYGFLF